jgi:hypothetical protein
MTKNEALKLALEALDCICSPLHVREIEKIGSAMKAIKKVLAQPEFVLNGIDCSCGRKWRVVNNTLTASEQPEQEFFVIKHYSADERPTIKGNGFDGLEVGTDREDAEKFIKWVNARISTPPQPKPEQESDDLTIAYMSGFHDGKNKNAPQRKPLTDEQLIAAYESEQQGRYGDHIRSLRAIEAAHGIKGE